MSAVIVAMSGGVDSAVAASLLKAEGREVIGVMMSIWSGASMTGVQGHHSCYGPEDEDIEDGQRIAESLGIKLQIFDLRSEYREEVIEYVCGEYMSGRTPNPCIRCNRMVKLDLLVERAREAGIAFKNVATGHYVRTGWDEELERYILRKALDKGKDQSYFLYSLSQAQLARSVFPIGDYTKEEVRRLAADFRLGVENKGESQDFIAGGYTSLLQDEGSPGDILDQRGNVLGKHRGIQYYTVGQRRGLGVSAKESLYVTAIDKEKNAVIVGVGDDVMGRELVCSELNWISIEELTRPLRLKARIRYRHTEADAEVYPLDKDRVHVKFVEPQRAITPGQAVVFYDGDVVAGGGTIEMAGDVRG